jgi:hypothetical protein
VDGYRSVGDGGSGQFFWNAADERAPDGGTIFSVTGIATGRWNRVFDGTTYNVRWFGATGNGVTDDAAAIQTVLDIFSGRSNNFSGTVYFPTGNYALQTELVFVGNYSNSVTIAGQAVGAGGDNGASLIWNGAAGATMFQGQGMNTCLFENIGFNGNQLALYCVQLIPSRTPALIASFNNTFDHCIFQGATGAESALVCLNDNTATDAVANIRFNNCIFNGAPTIGDTTYCVLPQQPSIGNTEGFTFTSCEFSSALYGFYFEFSNNVMVFFDCGFSSIAEACIYAAADGQILAEECGFENAIEIGPYAGQGMFVQAALFVKVDINCCELVADVSGETLNTMFRAGGDMCITDCVVDGSGEVSTASHIVCAQILITGLRSSIRVSGCDWSNFGSAYNPAPWNSPISIATHIPVNDGGNFLTSPGGVGADSRVAIILENNRLIDTSSQTHTEVPFYGTPPTVSPTGMVCDTAAAPTAYSYIYRGEPRQTTACYEIDASTFPASAATLAVNLERPAAKCKIIAVIAEVLAAFSGGTGPLTAEVGNPNAYGGPTDYLLNFDLTVPSGNNPKGTASGDLGAALASPVQGGFYLWDGLGGGTIIVTIAGDGVHLLNAWSAGTLRVYVTLEYLDFVPYA